MKGPIPRTARERQLEAFFEEYLAMGPRRTYGALGAKHQIEAFELLRHGQRFAWGERINFAEKAHAEAIATPVAARKGSEEVTLNQLHLARLVFLQKKAMDFLENVAFDRPETAMKMLVECMKLEREIKGLDKNKTDDLREVMMERLKEASPSSGPEFPYDPNLLTEELTDGPSDPAPPTGG